MRGTSGTYTKFGVDPQEDQLKAIKSPDEISEGSTSDHWFGVEPDSLYGTLENFAPGGETEIVRSK